MSTRSTLWYSEDLHLFTDGLDNENVYLEIRSQFFEELVIKIPLVAWKEMRQHTIQPEERFLGLSDAELRHEAEREVDAHREYLATRANSKMNSLFGAFVFGPADSSRDEMIEHFLRTYRPDLVARNDTESNAS